MVERKVSIESCSLVNQTIVDEIHILDRLMHHHIHARQKTGDEFAQDFHQQSINEVKEKIAKYKKALEELKSCGCLMTLKP